MRLKTIGFLLPALALTLQADAGPLSPYIRSDLSDEGRRVVDYLLADWKQKFRSTSIPWAMDNLGIGQDDELRFEVANYLRANKRKAKNLKWWGANNYILTDDEKRIAKYLLNGYGEEQHLPTLDELASAVELPTRELDSSLAFMAKVGFLVKASAKPLGYDLAAKAHRWGGPLRHNYHTAMIAGQKPFGVW